MNAMISRNLSEVTAALALVAALGLTAASCGGSRAQANKKEAPAAPAAPPAVEVTTAPAIQRDLPRFVEATGSLAADEQTDVAPIVGGRVVSVGVDLGSYVQTGRAAVRAAQVQVEQAQKGVRDVTIYSPISGYVVERAANVGEFVATSNK